MTPSIELKNTVFRYLNTYGFCINTAGIRYGSVLYLGFGESTLYEHKKRPATTRYQAEIEIGSDYWSLERNNSLLIDSSFSDINDTRSVLEDLLVGVKLKDIEITNETARIVMGEELVLQSSISLDPASGFLYSFGVEGGLVWETIDGNILTL